MKTLGRESWHRFCQAAGVVVGESSWFDELQRRYSEPVRAYHNGQHIAECLAEFESTRHLAQAPVLVELAIWFHDAVYDPQAGDNEELSAELARRCIAGASLDDTASLSVGRLVMATKHHDGSLHSDAPLLVDIDLSILGQGAERFWEYERQIRQEYQRVPEEIFNAKRAEILERFLARKSLYATGHFQAKYEARARINLTASIARLRRGSRHL